MYKALLSEAINKLKEEHPAYSDRKCYEELSSLIEEISAAQGERETISYRSLYNYLEKIKRNEAFVIRPNIANALSSYLGYTDYTQYATQKTKEAQTLKDKVQGFYSKHRAKSVGILALVLLAIVWINRSSTQQQWMQWQGNQYVEVPFNKEQHQLGTLKVLDQKTLNQFKRVQPNCNTIFFTGTDKPLVWYGKAPNKEYQFFSHRGDHPLTGKPLKPITRYMIKKYICP